MPMPCDQFSATNADGQRLHQWPPSRSKYTKKKLVYGHNSTSPSYVCWVIFANPRVCPATSSYLGGPHLSIGLTSHFLGPTKLREAAQLTSSLDDVAKVQGKAMAVPPPSKPKRYEKNACRVASWDVRPLHTLCLGLAVRETVENNDITCPCKPQGLWLERNSLAPRIPTGHFCSQDSVSCHCLDKTHDQRPKLFVVLSTDWVRYEFRYWLIQ